MSQSDNPTVTDKMVNAAEADLDDEPTFRDFLRFATVEIRNSIQHGRELQKDIDARKAQINAALDQLLKAA